MRFLEPEDALVLRKVAEQIISLPPEQIRQVLIIVDRHVGLDALWGKGVTEPDKIAEAPPEPTQAKKDEEFVKIGEYEVDVSVLRSAIENGYLNALSSELVKYLYEDPAGTLENIPEAIKPSIENLVTTSLTKFVEDVEKKLI
jgi:hypothetical protein